MSTIDRVRARDGRLVPFDPQRITESILDAMAECGEGNAELAEELTSAIVHFLEVESEARGSGRESAIALDRIDDQVEKVLMETGHRVVARAYIVRRERRARIRERRRAMEKRFDRGDGPPRGALHVQDRFDGEASPWSRERISEVLMEEGHLEATDADAVAAAVEERVLRSGQPVITTALIRELVDSELFVRGFTESLRQQSSVSIPKHDLERLLFRGGDPERSLFPGDARHTSRTVGDMILRQYVLEHVYDAEQRACFRRGDLHLHRIEQSLLLLRVPLSADRLAERPHRRSGGSVLQRLFTSIGELRSSVADEIEVFGLGEALLWER
ncbi:MAG: hypothetical protein KDC38_18990, partial [Planctomycetes bacterium]|nr:hypothetical protein [Planctomycetota bacterium]